MPLLRAEPCACIALYLHLDALCSRSERYLRVTTLLLTSRSSGAYSAHLHYSPYSPHLHYVAYSAHLHCSAYNAHLHYSVASISFLGVVGTGPSIVVTWRR